MKEMTRLGLVLTASVSIMFGFVASASALPGVKPKGATLQDLGKVSNPEIDSAETRVQQAKAQVELANKQVTASRALLKAAQADFKAAQSHLDALRLTAHAQGLVNETGMTPAVAAPVSVASKVAPEATSTTTEPVTEASKPAETEASSAPTPAPTTDGTRIHGTDFNSEPATEAPTILLR